jgi:CubicO group peptidase (beta-lactamase class C family)
MAGVSTAVRFVSSDDRIVRVASASGTAATLTAVGLGTARVTATSVVDTTVSATMQVTVIAVPAGALDITVSGVVSGSTPVITLSGPNGARRTTSGGTVANLEPGTWTLDASFTGARMYAVVPTAQVSVSSSTTTPVRVRYASVPVGGTAVPSLIAFDDTMLAFVQSNSIPAGEIEIRRAGKTVFARSYGWADQARTTEMTPGRPMRLASLTKPVTEAAIRQLIAAGKISLSTKAIAYLGLTVLPAGTTVDPRFADITIQQLMEHTAGFGASGSIPDPRGIARTLGLSRLPTPTETAQWYMGTPLTTTPGATYSYSNHGYLFLGLIVEKASGQDYLTYIRTHLWTGTPDVAIGKTAPAERDPREPWYYDTGTGCSTLVLSQCILVPWPDGGISQEAQFSYGGLVMTPATYMDFMANYGGDGVARPVGGGYSWVWYGSLPGTATIARWYPDGVMLTAFFDSRIITVGTTDTAFDILRTKLDAIKASITVWP